MKTRVDKLETEVDSLKLIVMPLKDKVDKLHDKKGEDNGKLQTFAAMLEMFEKNQNNFGKILREEMQSLSKTLSTDIAKLMTWKSMLIGGAGVGSVMIGGAVFMFKMYLDYYR